MLQGVKKARTEIIPMDIPNGAFFPFWPDLEDWQTWVQLGQNDIWLGLPMGCQLALVSALKVTQKHTFPRLQREMFLLLIIPVLVFHLILFGLYFHLFINLLQGLVVLINSSFQAMSLYELWCINHQFDRQASRPAKNDEVWSQPMGGCCCTSVAGWANALASVLDLPGLTCLKGTKESY